MKITQDFLDDCKGLVFNENMGCFTDPVDLTNWWVETYRRTFALRNRDTGQKVDKEFAEACIEATQERSGGLVRRNGKKHDVTVLSGRPTIKKD